MPVKNSKCECLIIESAFDGRILDSRCRAIHDFGKSAADSAPMWKSDLSCVNIDQLGFCSSWRTFVSVVGERGMSLEQQIAISKESEEVYACGIKLGDVVCATVAATPRDTRLALLMELLDRIARKAIEVRSDLGGLPPDRSVPAGDFSFGHFDAMTSMCERLAMLWGKLCGPEPVPDSVVASQSEVVDSRISARRSAEAGEARRERDQALNDLEQISDLINEEYLRREALLQNIVECVLHACGPWKATGARLVLGNFIVEAAAFDDQAKNPTVSILSPEGVVGSLAICRSSDTSTVEVEGADEITKEVLQSAANRISRLAGMGQVKKSANRSLEEVMQSNKDLQQFAHVASHDLRQPLRVMCSFAQLLRRRYSEQFDDTASQYLAYIEDAGSRLQRMILGLMNLLSLDTSTAGLREVALDGVVEQSVKHIASKLQEKNGQVISESLPRVVGDPDQLLQLFQNLISNGLKFNESDSPSVRISAKVIGGEWAVTFEDNGIGIDPDHCERIFELFIRLNSRSAYEGSGIGLAICRRIVERHGGRIWTDSVPGRGASVRFTLPIAGLNHAVHGVDET